jgi:hypothetical protein
MRGINAIRKLSLGLLLFFLLCVAGCKKCYTCQNVCIHCTKQNAYIDMCNTDYPVQMIFDNARESFTDGGYTCMQVAPSQYFKYCDEKTTAENLRTTYERLRYECD